MDNNYVGQIVERYAQAHNAIVVPVKDGRWNVLVNSVTVDVHHFPQKTRWEGLTTLCVNIVLGDTAANLKYHYAWISYPEYDKVSYDSFAYAINQMLKKHDEDLEFERMLHPNRTISTGS